MANQVLSSDVQSIPPAPTFLRLSAGFVYFFFGFLKFFPDLSPAELIASQTLMRLSFGMLDANTALFLLAIMECLIGLSFLFNIFMPWLFFLFLFHQAMTFTALFIFPEITFKIAPFAPTMEGQYIFKNLISLSAGWTVMLPGVKAHWANREHHKLYKFYLKHFAKNQQSTAASSPANSSVPSPALSSAPAAATSVEG